MQNVSSMTAAEVKAEMTVYVPYLRQTIKVDSVSTLDGGCTVRLYRVNHRGVELPIELGASEHVYLREACAGCGAVLQPVWLKDGTCNGCRNPHLIVKAVLS